jgi:flagellar basal body-associated protein FliL
MLSSKLVISMVAVVVVSVIVVGGVVLLRPCDQTVAAKQSAAQPPAMNAQTRKFFSGEVKNSPAKGY